MPYCVLPLSVLQYIAVLQDVVRLIKEHIMSLKLAKKLSRNVKLYCILQCNNWILTTWKAKNVAIYLLQCAVDRYSSSDVLYCIAVMNIAIY